MRAKKSLKLVSASVVAVALAGVGMSAASAATGTSAGCTVYSQVPFKSGPYVYGYGSGSCSTTANRTLFIEVHRSEGWWHPLISSNSQNATGRSYSVGAAGCDDGQNRFYFTEVSFNGGVEINSGDSSWLASSC